MESVARGACCLQPGRLAVQQVEQHSRGPGRVLEGPEPGFDAIVAEFSDPPDISGDDGKAGCHRLDDGQRLRVEIGSVHVSPIAGQEFAHVRPESAEAHLFSQAQLAGLAQEVFAQRPLAEDVERQGSPGPLGLGQDVEQEAVVLGAEQAAHGNQVPQRFLPRICAQRRHEVADDGGGNSGSLGQPAQDPVLRRPGHVHEPVNPGDHLAFVLPDRPEQVSATLDLVLVSPLIGLRGLEVNRQHHALVRSPPRAQGGPGSQGILGVDDALAHASKAPAECLAQESLVPVPVPGDAGGPTASFQYEGPEGVDGVAQWLSPRERCDQRGGHAVPLQVLPQLLDVGVDARDASLPEDGRDDKWLVIPIRGVAVG